MTSSQRLEQYLDQMRLRVRRVIALRAAAVIAGLLLLITCVAVLRMQRYGITNTLLIGARVSLLLGITLTAVVLLWWPLRKLRDREGAAELERRLPDQNGRIETYLDQVRRSQQGEPVPLLELLAEDAAVVAERTPVEEAISPKQLLVPGTLAAAAALAVTLMMTVGSSYWGFGSRRLWLGMQVPQEQIALREIVVAPGNAKVRRNQDLAIKASIKGFVAEDAVVHVKFAEAQEWETAQMQPSANDKSKGDFEFTMFALREPMRYYVSANGVNSDEHTVDVVDPPQIQSVRLTYHYPQWTGLAPLVDNEVRDIRAVAGTRVDIEVQSSAPLDTPTMMVNGAKVALNASGNVTRGTLQLQKDGQYQISAAVGDAQVALTDEYQIQIVVDEKPTIEIEKPGRDWHASSIEEVPVSVRANDDFRVQNVELHYAINGGAWQTTKLPVAGKEVRSNTDLKLEEMTSRSAKGVQALTPGDIVTYYAVAKDHEQTVQTDLFLVQVEPFDRRYRQGQGGGGGGGGGGMDDQADISARQREILLATWNLQRSQQEASRDKQRIEDNARMLAELQTTLASQANTMVERARARQMTNRDEQVRNFIENLELASKAMQPAAERLAKLDLPEAIPNEQTALQHLLRAEALFKDIQVSMQNGGGGGGGGQAGRDLSEMLDLEMDLEKNQYETEAQISPEKSSQQLDDAVNKLRELAQRQERLAREVARQQTMPEAQRWQQEQLRREAEDLRRRLQELAQQENRGSQRNAQNGQQGQSAQGQASNSQSGQRAQQGQATQALNQLNEAMKNMQGAANGQQGNQGSAQANAQANAQADGQASARAAQQASEKLRQALNQIDKNQREGVAGSFENFANRARALRQQQQQSEEQLHDAVTSAQRSTNPNQAWQQRMGNDGEERLANQKRDIQNGVQALDQDMRMAAQRNARETPKAVEQLKQASSQLAESQISSGLARSAQEIEYGRPVQAAARDGVITDALRDLETKLAEAARTAARESGDGTATGPRADADDLLAELAELRRAWQQAQQGQGNAQGGNQGSSQGNSQANAQNGNASNANRSAGAQQAQGQQAGNNAGQGSQGQGSQGQGSQGQGSQGQGSQGSGGGQNAANGGGGANGGARGGLNGGLGGGGGWNAGVRGSVGGQPGMWNGLSAPGAARNMTPEEMRQQANAIAQRLRQLQGSLPGDVLSAAELSALKELSSKLASGRDAMQSEYPRMLSIVNQLELAALKAKSKDAETATRATTTAQDTPEYRDNVAEYYRRLGGNR